MSSPIIIITAVESGFGFLLSALILYLILSRRRQAHHYFFAAFLFICLFWDGGTFLLMVRNSHVEELPVIGYFIGFPCGFIPALIYHFSCLYAHRPTRWLIIFAWAVTAIFFVLGFFGLYWEVEGIYAYDWGNIFKVANTPLSIPSMIAWFGLCSYSVWLLFKAARTAIAPLERRHYTYVATGVLVITLAIVKVLVVMGVNLPFVLPLGMFLVDVFNAIIGLAIIKERLFDITIIVKKGTIYSILAGLLVLIYSVCEHFLITYVGETLGENSLWIHLVSVALGIAILMPVKKRIERGVDGLFARRTLEF